MIDGLYVVSFGTPFGDGAGIVSMRDNRFEGGDPAMLYRGSVTQQASGSEAHMSVVRHTEGVPSVLGVGSITLNGSFDDTYGQMQGLFGGVLISVEIRRCGDFGGGVSLSSATADGFDRGNP